MKNKAKEVPIWQLPTKFHISYSPLEEKWVGRDEELKLLVKKLRKKYRVAICGKSGVGKTSLAIEYVHKYRDNYPGGVYWYEGIRGLDLIIGELAIFKEVSAVMREKSLVGKADEFTEICNNSKDPSPMLVVIDNLEEFDLIKKILPGSKKIHVLITSPEVVPWRDRVIHLESFSTTESLEYFKIGPRKFEEDIQPLADKLENLPLALYLAKEYLTEKKISVVEYVAQIEDMMQDTDFCELKTILTLSWEAVSPLAQKILIVLSLLAQLPVPYWLFRKVVASPEEESLPQAYEKETKSLQRFGLIMKDDEGRVNIHPLTKAFISSLKLSTDQIQTHICKILREELAQVRNFIQTPITKQKIWEVTPHCEEFIIKKYLAGEDLVKVCLDMGYYFNWKESTQKSLTNYELAYQEACQMYPPGNLELAKLQSEYAVVLANQGNTERGLDLAAEAMDWGRVQYKSGNLFLAELQTNLAIIWFEAEDANTGDDLLREAYNWTSLELDNEGVTTFKIKIALASRYANVKRYVEAEYILNDLINFAEKRFGLDQYAVTNCKFLLVNVLSGLNKVDDAIELSRDLVEEIEYRFKPWDTFYWSGYNLLADALVLSPKIDDLLEGSKIKKQVIRAVLFRVGQNHFWCKKIIYSDITLRFKKLSRLTIYSAKWLRKPFSTTPPWRLKSNKVKVKNN